MAWTEESLVTKLSSGRVSTVLTTSSSLAPSQIVGDDQDSFGWSCVRHTRHITKEPEVMPMQHCLQT